MKIGVAMPCGPQLTLERAEVLVDFCDGQPAVLETGPDGNAPMMMRMMGGGNRLRGERQAIIRFELRGTGTRSAQQPDKLVTHQR